MKLLKTLTGSAILAGLLLGTGGCELIVAPDRTKIGEGGGGEGGTGGTGGTTTTGGGGQGGTTCTPEDDSNDCTEDVCENGAPVHNPLAAGEACSAGVCDGAGVCVECLEPADCNDPLKTCKRNACIDVTCMDSELNGEETDVDCGGMTCPKCADDKICEVGTDCESGVCTDDGGGLKCQAPTCDDTVQNGTETAVDCGGSCVASDNKKCADGDGCSMPADCQSGVCGAGNTCSVPACGDGVMNQPTEACDDGNMVNGDTCDNNCTIPGCGNGELGGTEECDDGNMTNGDGCDINCTVSECGNGQVGGTEVCDDGNKTNDDGCDDGTNGNCTPTGCGNGVLTGTEVCDDGNSTLNDGCDDGMNGNCTVTACGNGVQTGTEVCDDGNNANGDGCDDGSMGNCTVSACGNGVLAGTEQCDDGNIANNDGCDSNCTNTGCGNGVVTMGEACDDGNDTNGDGCDDGATGNCTATACGNNVVTMGEACDDGNTMNGDGCDSNCTIAGCGNGVVVAPEVCDDGNMTSGDGCDINCTNTACGNGIVTMGETCDDGNLTNNDGCDSNCKPTGCGNGIQTGSEQCDDNNTTGGDGCSATCTTENLESEMNGTCGTEDGPFTPNPTVNVIAAITPVGDLDFFSFTLPGPGVSSVKIETFQGVVPGACPAGNDTIIELRGTDCTTVLASDDDDGLNACSLIDAAGADTGARKLPAGTYFVRVAEFNNDATLASYNVNITILSTCGNGMTQPTEACDDGNLTSGDGCDSNCTTSACGNGIVAGTEACDDGNTTAGDGCSATCTVESGYTCMGSPSVCAGVCNNGIIEFNEGCEDGNTANGDCCSSTCQVASCETEMNGTCMGTQNAMPPFSQNPKIAYASGAITPSGDADFWSFTLTKPATVRVESFTTKVGQCTADTLIELRGTNCTTNLIGDDDDGVNACSLINPTVAADAAARNLPAGTYFVRVAAFSGTIASYGIAVTLVDECGNGTKGAFETGCDDGNNTSGDGCSATCAVEAGFTCTGTAPTVCTDIDECTLNTDNCDANATCGNTPGSFTCTCNSGYSGNGVTCTDIDECTLNTDNCSANATCGNTPGSFTCTCNMGFTGNGVTCTDIDECTLNTDNCDANATCGNTPGSFTCTCNGEYIGSGTICSLTESCDELHTAKPALVDGDYMIDSDGTGGNSAFTVRCDMTTDGGGWTLVFNDTWNSAMGVGFNETLAGSGAETGFSTNFINLAYSTVAIGSDVMIDASDSAIVGTNQEARTIITGAAAAGQTMRARLQGGTAVFFDNDANTNITTSGLTCGSFGKWADYEAAVCTAGKVLVGNDQVGAANFSFGIDNSSSSTDNNSAGWPQDPNFGGTNFFPDNFRVWVR